jgi:hypothetical protein
MGFNIVPKTSTTTRSLTKIKMTRGKELSNIDEMCIENAAELCLRTDVSIDECDLEEHVALLAQLKDQKVLLEEHVAKVDVLIARMEGKDVPEEEPYIPG